MDLGAIDPANWPRSLPLTTSNCGWQAQRADGIAGAGSRRGRGGVANLVLMLEEMPLTVWLQAILVRIREHLARRVFFSPQ
jgi:hypothetical protein